MMRRSSAGSIPPAVQKWLARADEPVLVLDDADDEIELDPEQLTALLREVVTSMEQSHTRTQWTETFAPVVQDAADRLTHISHLLHLDVRRTTPAQLSPFPRPAYDAVPQIMKEADHVVVTLCRTHDASWARGLGSDYISCPRP